MVDRSVAFFNAQVLQKTTHRCDECENGVVAGTCPFKMIDFVPRIKQNGETTYKIKTRMVRPGQEYCTELHSVVDPAGQCEAFEPLSRKSNRV